MTPEQIENLQKDIEDVLPGDYGYILITLPVGVPAAPTFLSNMERGDSSATMRAILGVFDEKN